MDKLFNEEKMFTFISGVADGANMTQTPKALYFAREKHKEQKRKNGEPYIIHPLTMACHAKALGILDDNILAAILLHDVCEDCDVPVALLPVNDAVKTTVKLLTFTIFEGESKEEAKRRYYNLMLENKEAVVAKLIDRCHNVSSMAGVFSIEKLEAYVKETREYVLPLIKKSKELYPEYRNAFFALKYHITSIVNSIDMVLNGYDLVKSNDK